MLHRLDEHTKKPTSLGTLLHEFGSPADRRMEEERLRKARARGALAVEGADAEGAQDAGSGHVGATQSASSGGDRRRLAVRGTIFGVDEVELKLCIWEAAPVSTGEDFPLSRSISRAAMSRAATSRESLSRDVSSGDLFLTVTVTSRNPRHQQEPGQPLFLSPFVFTIVAEDEEADSTYECKITSSEIPVFWAPSSSGDAGEDESKRKDFMNEPLAHALFSCLRLIDHPTKGKLFFVDKHRFAQMTKIKAKEHFSKRSGKARARARAREHRSEVKGGGRDTQAYTYDDDQARAAIRIQAAARGQLSRRKAKGRRKRHRHGGSRRRRGGGGGPGRDKVSAEFTPVGAATKVQSLFRGARDRKSVRARRANGRGGRRDKVGRRRRGGGRGGGRRRGAEKQDHDDEDLLVVKA